MFISSHLVFAGGLVFAALWLVFISMQAGLAAALADSTSRPIQAALTRIVPLTVVTGAMTVLLAGPASSVVSSVRAAVHQQDAMIHGAVAAIWVGYLSLTVVMLFAVVRLVRGISARRAGKP